MSGGVSGQRKKRKMDDSRDQEKAWYSSGSRVTSRVNHPRSRCGERDDVNAASVSCSRELKRKRNPVGFVRRVWRNITGTGDEGTDMRHMNMSVTKRFWQAIKNMRDVVFDKGRESKGKLPGYSKSSHETMDVYDDGSEHDSRIIKWAGEAEEKTSDSLAVDVEGSKDSEELPLMSCSEEVDVDMKYRCYHADGFENKMRREVEDKYEDGEGVMIRVVGDDETDSNEHSCLDCEEAQNSEELLHTCSCDEVNDVPRNKHYPVDESGILHFEVETTSTFAESEDETVAGVKNKRHREEEDEYEVKEDVIMAGVGKEDSVDRGSRDYKADSNEHTCLDCEEAKNSDELPAMCSSDEVSDVPRNKRYLVNELGTPTSAFLEKEEIDSTLARKMSSGMKNKRSREVEDQHEDEEDVIIIGGADDKGAKHSEGLLPMCLESRRYTVDEFGKLHSEDELMSTFVEEREGNETEAGDTSYNDNDKEKERDDVCCSSVHVEEGRNYEQQQLLPPSRGNENGYSMDHSAHVSSHRLPDCVAHQTRSRFKRIRRDTAKAATFSNPSRLLENRCYLVDEFGKLHSEDELISTFVEEREGNDTEDDDDDDYNNDGDDDDKEKERDDDCCSSVHVEEGRNYEQQQLLPSREKKNGSSMDHSANVSNHRLPDCVAHQTRSRFKRIRRDTTKAARFSNPSRLDDENDDQKIASSDDSSSSSRGASNKRRVTSEGRDEENGTPPDRNPTKHVDDTEEIHLANSASGKGDEMKQETKGIGQKNVTLFGSKHIRDARDARKVMLEAIWSQRDTLRESMNTATPKVARITNRLFTFGEEDSEPPAKSEAELEFDKLWLEFDFCLRSCELENGNTDMDENGDLRQPILNPCLRGEHDAILDEEIGYRCRNCSFIIQEIRDVVAPFRKDPVERRVKRDNGRGDGDFLRKLLNENKMNDLSLGCPSDHDATAWDLVPGMKSSLYPHQQEGFEFIWKNIAGAVDLSEVDRLKESNEGNGCIISHAPGTGKSRLAVVFLQAYLRLFPDCRPVIIAPTSMMLTWEQEFQKWNVDIPFHNLNNDKLSGKEDVEALRIHSRFPQILRLVKLYSWIQRSSVLGISYSLFQSLTSWRNTKEDDRSEGDVLLKLPGLLVLDEGHTPRNKASLTWQVLSNVRTQKRVCLSGTPFQNNFDELYNTFCMARPGFASTMSLRDWANLTNSICDNNTEALEDLKAMVLPFVHIYKGKVLQDTLPGLSQRVVYLRPTSRQKRLLEAANGIQDFRIRHFASLVSVHPTLLPRHSSAMITRLLAGIREELQGTKLTPWDGAKTKFLIEFLRRADALKEKVLVFSEFLDPLMFLKDQLKSYFGWTEGEEMLYMDGKLNVRKRQASISTFNDDDSKAKVLLASTKACFEGISFVGASRVILLDAAWNPSVQRQAICRAYRLGQKRFVYAYCLVTHETIEEEVYRQQMHKYRLSNMIFPSANKEDDFNEHSDTTTGPEDKILLEMLQNSISADLIEKVEYYSSSPEK